MHSQQAALQVKFQSKIHILSTILFETSQKDVSKMEYGPTLPDLKKQIAAHNILHKEIESYNNQLSPGSTSSQVRL